MGEYMSKSIIKIGELNRDGYLSNITVYRDDSKEKNITIIGKFINTGQIELNAKYITKIFNETKLIDTIETEEKKIPKKMSFMVY